MQFLLYALDKDNHLNVRMENRPDHLEFLKAHEGTDSPVRILIAGALRADDGETMIGSVVIVEAENKSAVEDFAQNDPYAKAGLFKSVDIKPYGIAPFGLGA